MVMHALRPRRAWPLPLRARARLRHAGARAELATINRLVNAFFRWEFNSCEVAVKDGHAYPIDYANASPDIALVSLHYYFPWAIESLAACASAP